MVDSYTEGSWTVLGVKSFISENIYIYNILSLLASETNSICISSYLVTLQLYLFRCELHLVAFGLVQIIGCN